MTEQTLNPVELATELTIAWLGNQNNRVPAEDVPNFLRSMHSTILELETGSIAGEPSDGQATEVEDFAPAVSVRKSLASKDHIISMIDGKPYKTLRRHLTTHGLTDTQYRERYKLRADYPMVAETYSLARRAMAQQIGLGRKGRGGTPTPDVTPGEQTTEPAPKRMRRKTSDQALRQARRPASVLDDAHG